jgi:hypothetical protein
MAGGVLGTAVMTTVAASRTSDVLSAGDGTPALALTEGFQDAFAAGIAFGLLGAAVAILFLNTGRPAPAVAPAAAAAPAD